MDLHTIATFLAILMGPVTAVLITRWVDNKRLKQARRMEVFRTLMRTRRMRLTPDHVGALNLVEIEFHDEKPIIDAWKAYWSHLAKPFPSNNNNSEQDRFVQDGNSLHTRLLYAIAKALRFEIEQMEIFEGGYVPQGWENDELYQRTLRNLLVDILSGRRGIPIVPLNTGAVDSPYPPPPSTMQ